MDEEDGRPGPRARKFGPGDVLTDVFAGSLCRRPRSAEKSRLLAPLARISMIRACFRSSSIAFNPFQFPRLVFGADLPEASAPSR
jgi:hypothetical protein